MIGRVCAQILAREVPELMLIGRRPDALDAVRDQCTGIGAQVRTSLDHAAPSTTADLILTVTSATHAVIEPQHLKPGAVVCDVARPRDVSIRVAKVRDDVLVIEGGMVEVPGPVDFGFNFGFPPGKSYACMAETMALALEGRYEDYSVGKNISLDAGRTRSGRSRRGTASGSAAFAASSGPSPRSTSSGCASARRPRAAAVRVRRSERDGLTPVRPSVGIPLSNQVREGDWFGAPAPPLRVWRGGRGVR